MRAQILFFNFLFTIFTFATSSELPCDLSLSNEVPFEGTPIWKTFNKTSNRTECIIACWSYPVCSKVRKNYMDNRIQSDDQDKQQCEDKKTALGLKEVYMKGPGWHLHENKGRIEGTGTCKDLPIKVQGFEVLVCWGQICLIMQTDCSGSRLSSDQSCAISYPTSCSQIKAENQEAKSGEYIIKMLNGRILEVMCDMESDGGGWMAIFNYTDTSMYKYNDVDNECGGVIDLPLVKNGQKCIKVSDLKQTIEREGYKQIRFYCLKPSVGRTIDIATKNDSNGWEVMRYFMGDVTDRPPSCDSYYRLRADNSILTSKCGDWFNKKWGSSSRAGTLGLYRSQFFSQNLKVHYLTGVKKRWECDDEGNDAGSWIHYLR